LVTAVGADGAAWPGRCAEIDLARKGTVAEITNDFGELANSQAGLAPPGVDLHQWCYRVVDSFPEKTDDLSGALLGPTGVPRIGPPPLESCQLAIWMATAFVDDADSWASVWFKLTTPWFATGRVVRGTGSIGTVKDIPWKLFAFATKVHQLGLGEFDCLIPTANTRDVGDWHHESQRYKDASKKDAGRLWWLVPVAGDSHDANDSQELEIHGGTWSGAEPASATESGEWNVTCAVDFRRNVGWRPRRRWVAGIGVAAFASALAVGAWWLLAAGADGSAPSMPLPRPVLAPDPPEPREPVPPEPLPPQLVPPAPGDSATPKPVPPKAENGVGVAAARDPGSFGQTKRTVVAGNVPDAESATGVSFTERASQPPCRTCRRVVWTWSGNMESPCGGTRKPLDVFAKAEEDLLSDKADRDCCPAWESIEVVVKLFRHDCTVAFVESVTWPTGAVGSPASIRRVSLFPKHEFWKTVEQSLGSRAAQE